MPDTAKTTCPICKKPSTTDYAPFCSKRCADLDLGKWLDGNYILAGQTPLGGMDEGEDE